MPSWPHAPTHHLSSPGAYIITAATYQKLPHFRSASRLQFLRDSLLDLAQNNHWHLQAWAIFPNHYHFIAIFPTTPIKVSSPIRELHSWTAKEMNQRDATPGRRIWFQFWDSHLTFQRSYLARLNYVHTNPVHHGLVREPTNYPWCSAAWFQQESRPSFYKSVMSFPTNKLTIPDNFEVDPTTIT